MNAKDFEDDAWTLVMCASEVCKPLLWLHDSDSPQRLAPELRKPLEKALQTVVRFPDALPALKGKMCSIYDVALCKPLVGIGASPIAGREGKRTAKDGLLAALDFAREHKTDFEQRAQQACSTGTPDWNRLFSLAETFIDNSDWGAFVLENARGQAACLVLECIELLEAVCKDDLAEMQKELGDVFYNIMALCLSLRIHAEHLELTSKST